MLKSHLRRGLRALLIVALLATASPVDAADVPAAKRLPPEVVFYVTAPNVSDLKSRFKQHSFGRMIADPALGDFLDGITTSLAEASDQAKAELGVSLDDLLDLPSGTVTLAVFAGGERPLGWLTLVDFGKNRATIDKLLVKASEGLVQGGAKKTLVEAGGASITSFQLPAPPKPNPTDPNAESGLTVPKSLLNVGWFIKDTTLVMGNGAGTLRSVLARWDGEHTATFAGNPIYRYIAKHGASDGPQPVLEWYFDPITTVQSVILASDPNNFQAQLALGFLPTLGLDKVKAIGGTVNIATPKFDEVTRTVIYVDTPRTGALNILKFPAVAQQPPKWVPASSTSYWSLNWDLQAAWRGVANIVDSFNAQGPGTFDQLADEAARQPNGPMIHPKKDLIDHLSGRIQLITDSPETAEGQPSASRMLLALGIKNASGITATIGKLANTPGSPLVARQFRGVTIYDLPNPLQAGAGVGTDGMALAVHQGQLMLAMPGTLLEQIIRGDVKPLSESAEYKQLATAFPTRTSVISFGKSDSQMKSVYDLIKGGGLPLPPNAGANALPLDFTKLPPFETIKKYLQPSGTYIIPDENGVVIVGFSLRPKSKP